MQKNFIVFLINTTLFLLITGCAPSASTDLESRPVQTQEQISPTDEEPEPSTHEPDEALDKAIKGLEKDKIVTSPSPTPSSQHSVHFLRVGQGE